MALPRILLFFIINLFSCDALHYEATVIQSVRLNKRDVGRFLDITALPDKPFHIVFEEIDAKDIRCQYVINDIDSRCEDCKFTNITSVLIIDSVTNEMSTKWTCKITSKVNDDSVPVNGGKTYEYLFNMRVKRAKKIDLKIIGNDMNFNNTDLSVKYDGIYNYKCEEGYTVDLTCTSNYDEGTIIMRYYNAQGIRIWESDTVVIHHASLMFRQLMTNTNYSGSYVECTYSSISTVSTLDYTYRIKFTVQNKSASNDDFIVTINNVKLIPSRLANNTYEPNIYDYTYLNGEQLTATCENTKTQGDKMDGYFTDTQNKKISFTDITSMKPFAYDYSIDTTKLRSPYLSSFSCESSKDNRVKVHVKFSVGINQYPIVHGLRASGILLQYGKTNTESITKYQYTENESLNLSCLADSGWTSNWTSGDSQIPGFINGNITLKAEHNNMSITCEVKQNKETSRTMVIVFQLKLAEPVSNDDNDSSLGVIIGCVAGVLAVLVCAVCGYYLYTKKRVVGVTEERPNVNPSQSENYDYTYIETGGMIENAYYCGSTNYKIPQDNINNPQNPAEPHYTEIGDICNSKNEKKALTYDVPYAHLKKDDNVNLNNVNYENLNQENSNKAYSHLQRDINNMLYSNLKNKKSNYENF